MITPSGLSIGTILKTKRSRRALATGELPERVIWWKLRKWEWIWSWLPHKNVMNNLFTGEIEEVNLLNPCKKLEHDDGEESHLWGTGSPPSSSRSWDSRQGELGRWEPQTAFPVGVGYWFMFMLTMVLNMIDAVDAEDVEPCDPREPPAKR